MLLRFQVTNHASLRDEQEISFVASDDRPRRAQRPVPGTDLHTVPVAAVYGPNASGKSNLVDALAWMRGAVLRSFSRWDPSGGVPRRPYSLRREPGAVPSTYEIDLVLDGVRFEYGFTVDDEVVREEWLASFPEGRRRKLFDRRGPSAGTISYGRFFTGHRKTIADLTRENSLYLSVGAAHGHEVLHPLHRWFSSGLRIATDRDFNSRLSYTIDVLHRRDQRRADSSAEGEALTGLLSYADLGVDSLEFRDPDPRLAEEHKRVTEALTKALGGDRVRVEAPPEYDVQVKHRSDEGLFPLPLSEESSGTRTWIGMLGPVLTTLAEGGVLAVDELDARLHPHLSDALVGMFQDPEVNRTGAQLLFTTHETSLLGRHARTELFRDQVWFTEKDRVTLATRLYPVTDFHVRDAEGARDNLEKRYLSGRFGSLPALDDALLRDVADELTDGGASGTGEAAQARDGEKAGAA